MEVEQQDHQSRAETIAGQNDRFRQTFGADFTIPGRVVVTAGVEAKGGLFLQKLMVAVMGFDDFNEGNDPHGLRDFGIVTIDGARVYWKLDLFDPSYEWGAEDPANPARTRRVLTLLLPEEY